MLGHRVKRRILKAVRDGDGRPGQKLREANRIQDASDRTPRSGDRGYPDQLTTPGELLCNEGQNGASISVERTKKVLHAMAGRTSLQLRWK